MLKYIVIILLINVPAIATITIDDFSAGPLDVELSGPTIELDRELSDLPEENVFGGIRSVEALFRNHSFDILSNNRGHVTVDTANNRFSISGRAEEAGFFLAYGMSHPSFPEHAWNANFTNYNALRLDGITLTRPLDLDFILKSNFNEADGLTGIQSEGSVHLPASDIPYSILVPFSIFEVTIPLINALDFDFSDFDGLIIGDIFNEGEPFSTFSFDFTLGGINVVPEPSSVILMLFGSMLLIKRRTNKE